MRRRFTALSEAAGERVYPVRVFEAGLPVTSLKKIRMNQNEEENCSSIGRQSIAQQNELYCMWWEVDCKAGSKSIAQLNDN